MKVMRRCKINGLLTGFSKEHSSSWVLDIRLYFEVWIASCQGMRPPRLQLKTFNHFLYRSRFFKFKLPNTRPAQAAEMGPATQSFSKIIGQTPDIRTC